MEIKKINEAVEYIKRITSDPLLHLTAVQVDYNIKTKEVDTQIHMDKHGTREYLDRIIITDTKVPVTAEELERMIIYKVEVLKEEPKYLS